MDIPCNMRPWSSGNGVTFTFTSITIFRRDFMVNPRVNVYNCLKKVFELILHADPRRTNLPLYADKAGMIIVPITTIAGYPSDILGLGNYDQ